MPDAPTTRGLATFVWLLPPVWILPLPAAAWGYLAAGLGGQDLGALSWIKAVCTALSPYRYGEELDMVHLAVYVFIHGALYSILGAIAVGSATRLRRHAQAALIVALLTVPLVGLTPYGMGVVAEVPAAFSMVPDDPAFSAEWSRPARRAAGLLLAGILALAPGVLYWQDQLQRARAGEPAELPDSRGWVRIGVGVGIGTALLVAATLATRA